MPFLLHGKAGVILSEGGPRTPSPVRGNLSEGSWFLSGGTGALACAKLVTSKSVRLQLRLADANQAPIPTQVARCHALTTRAN